MALLSPVPFEWAFRACAIKWGVPWAMMAGMSAEASGFNPTIVGPTRDHGLLQIIESNAPGCGISVAELDEPKKNICCGASLLRKHFDRLRSTAASRRDLWHLVAMSNNMGSSFVRTRLAAMPAPHTWEAFKAATPGYPSKHAWVERMMATAEKYRTADLISWAAIFVGVGGLSGIVWSLLRR